jgi:intracellular sulfur oxidation DsrE/DsrF family protein
MKTGIYILLGLALTAGAAGNAFAKDDFRSILAMPKAPPGVVFEIVSGQEAALNWAIPEVKRQIEKLRARFPGLDVVVVSHGSEQFALTSKNHDRFRELHAGVQQLKQDKGVNVHVCGTHASWRNIEHEDFPDYVRVADAGPTTISKYREIGYVHLNVIKRDSISWGETE